MQKSMTAHVVIYSNDYSCTHIESRKGAQSACYHPKLACACTVCLYGCAQFAMIFTIRVGSADQGWLKGYRQLV